MNRVTLFFFVFSTIFLGGALNSLGQEDSTRIAKDSVNKDTTLVGHVIDDIRKSKLSKRVMGSITRRPSSNSTATIRSEQAFLAFEGKIIRRIIIHRIGFEKHVNDTTRGIKNSVTRIANRLHSNTREWVIRDNLFIKENKKVNPYKVADNERYLRDLDFILDARLYILPTASEDSVDIVVMTRDVFSLGGSFNPRSPTKTLFKVYDVNLMGGGQRAQFNGLVEDGRAPAFGYEFLYRKNSIGGSFITATAGYTQLNTGSSYGEEQEKAYFLRLDRPLVSPYTRFAGGIELSRNWSQNFYAMADSLFRDYSYLVNDFWIGYNIAPTANSRDRNRHFVAVRAFDQHFTRQPYQLLETGHPTYSNRTYVIGGLTFFKQDFYTARYIYGFGRTEDIPYGHSMSLYLGWSRQLGRERPYVGIDIGKSFVNKTGQFYNLAVRMGAYQNNGLEDAVTLVSGSVTSRLISYKDLLIRHTLTGDYTQLFNQKTILELDIDNELGIRGFATDSLWGVKRFHAGSETIVFTPLKLLGFGLAPFLSGEMAVLAADNKTLFETKPFFGIGGGLRTRNENLVFGTVELRLMYYPRTVESLSNFAIRVSSNLRVKYSASFVRPPSLVSYN